MAARDRKNIPSPLAATGTTTINREVVGDEYVTSLQDMGQRMRTYTRMRRGDGAVNTSLLAIEKPILGGSWDVGGDDEIAEACRDELFSTDRGAAHDPPLLEMAVEQLLGMFQYGFAAAEPFWELLEDGRVHCTNLTLIRQESVRTFKLDSQGFLESLVQNIMSPSYREITVPAAQLMLAVHAREGSDYSGVAIIRPSYRAFIERDTIRKTRLWHHDRFGAGTPIATYGESASDDDKLDVDAALESFRAGSTTFLSLPFGTTIQLVGGQSGYDPTSELGALAGEIAKNTLSQLMELGTGDNTGNRALGQSLGGVLKAALQGYAERIATIVRRQILTPFVKWNFGDTAEVPEITVRVTLTGVSELFEAVMMATEAGMKLEPEDIVALRDELELEPIDIEEIKRRIDARKPDITAPAPGEKPAPNAKPDLKLVAGAKKLSEPVATLEVDALPDYLGRLRPAKVVALENEFVKPKLLADALDREAVRATADVHDVLKEIDAALVSQVKALAEKGGQALALHITDITVPGRLTTKLRKAIAGAARRTSEIGSTSVRKELERQGLDVGSAAFTRRMSFSDRLNSLFTFGDPDLYGGLAAFLKTLIEIATQREVTAREQGAQQSALAALGDAATEQELDFAAIAQRVQSELEDRSVAAVESRVTQVLNVSFGHGRVEEGRLFGSNIESQIRSEVLDGNTCQWCAEHDGDEYEFGDSSAPDLPDANCDGTYNCRGIWIYALARRAA